jgi:hypothetical protein
MFVALLERLQGLERQSSRTVTTSELTDLLRKAVKIPQVRLYTSRSPGVDLDCVSIGGTYDSVLDADDEPCVEISVIYNTAQQHIDTANLNWPRLLLDLAECIGHEFVHRDQHRRKKRPSVRYRSKELDQHKKQEQEYLGSGEEIEAYGFSIAAEMASQHKCFAFDEGVAGQVLMYTVYIKTFDTDQSVVLKLQRQISKYLRRLEVDYNDKNNSRQRPVTGTRRSGSTGRSGRRK